MDNLKQLEDLHAYYEAMISGGYDGDDKETWETLHAALLSTKEQIKELRLNGGNGKKVIEGHGGNGQEATGTNGGNGGNGKEKPGSNGGNGKVPGNGNPVGPVTDNVVEEPAVYTQETG